MGVSNEGMNVEGRGVNGRALNDRDLNGRDLSSRDNARAVNYDGLEGPLTPPEAVYLYMSVMVGTPSGDRSKLPTSLIPSFTATLEPNSNALSTASSATNAHEVT